jgi:CheY-like chemotaxis protein
VANQPDTPAALRRILTEAVRSLRPEADEPPQSPAWRLYESLFYRYVQYFSQLEVAHQLGISTRQLRREQRAALEELAFRLWKQFDVEAKLHEDEETEAATAQGRVTSTPVYEDLAWLKEVPPDSPADLNQELPAVLDLIRPLAAQQGVCLEITMDDSLPHLATHPVALRQALLSLLSVAVSRASLASPGGRVHIVTRSQSGEVEIQVRCERVSSSPQAVADGDAASLDMAHQLADLFGGRLIISTEEAFSATLTLPVLGQLPVLAIDDNVDTLHLLQRYTAGTRYHLVGTRDPEQAWSLAEKLPPQIIVLDVMMPDVDGWEMLGRLRQHPLTAHIPVVVCTILAQEELALSLGASAFVRKPVTRRAFLAALDRQVAPMAPESH